MMEMYEYLLNDLLRDFDEMNVKDYRMMMMMSLNFDDFEIVVVVAERKCYNYPLKIIYKERKTIDDNSTLNRYTNTQKYIYSYSFF
jgi:hypothetical protein